MLPNEDSSPDQNSDPTPDAAAEQVAQLIRLVQTGEEANIKFTFLLAKGLGHPPKANALK